MASSGGETIIIPRNFKLLDELEKAEKGNTDMTISYGLADSADISLTHWQCTILAPPASALDGRIVSLLVRTGSKYPDEPPLVEFQSKVNFPFVDPSNGAVNFGKLPAFSWNRSMCIEVVLIALRNAFCKAEYKKLKQPPEGQTFA